MSDPNPFENIEKPVTPTAQNNPFLAPTAHVDDARPAGSSALLDEPAGLDAGRGSAWWSEGWSLFREATGVWIGIVIVGFIVTLVCNLIPVIGPFIAYLFTPVLVGGLMLGCRSLERGEGLSFNHLFAGFQKNFGQLALVGLFYMIGMLAIALIILATAFGGGMGALFMGDDFNPVAAFSTIMIGTLLGAALGVPLAMAVWFAPALVMLNDMEALPAMKLSFLGCWRNIVPFLVYGLIGIVLAFVASLPILLGWLLLAPTMVAATYIAYREIFLVRQ